MAEVTCVDGSALGIHPVPVVDRDGTPYELTLRLTRDGAPFGDVGERCGWFLAAAARALRAALRDGSAVSTRWISVNDRFPASSVEGGLRAWAVDEQVDADAAWATLERYLPRDRELFAFRHRDPDDLTSAGELRCTVHAQRTWAAPVADGAAGHWQLSRRAVLDAWGDVGVGLRSVLTAPALDAFLYSLLAEAAAVGCVYEDDGDIAVRRPAG